MDDRWVTVNEINKIRNLIIHSDGEVKANNEKAEEGRRIIEKRSGLLSIKEDELVIEPGYLEFVLISFDSLFQYLACEIKVKYAKPLSEQKLKDGKTK